jgi:hypothetical protein
VPLDIPLTFVERAALEPTTGTGPSPAELIAPTVLHFRAKRPT